MLLVILLFFGHWGMKQKVWVRKLFTGKDEDDDEMKEWALPLAALITVPGASDQSFPT